MFEFDPQQFESRETRRLAYDLHSGNEQDAIDSLRHVIHQPDALRVIRQAQQMAGPSIDQVVIDGAGDVSLNNAYSHASWQVGRLSAPFLPSPIGAPGQFELSNMYQPGMGFAQNIFPLLGLSLAMNNIPGRMSHRFMR